MIRIITLLTGLLVFISLYSQKRIEISATSNVQHIKLPSERYDSAQKPIIHFTNQGMISNINNKKYIESDSKLYNIKGITYVKDGSGIKKLLVNKERIELNKNDEFIKSCILLPGKNKYIIESWSNAGYATYDTLFINYLQTKTKNHFLYIAINDYKYWPDLKNPLNDGRRLVHVLHNKYGFEKHNILSLTNDSATLDNIYTNFKDIIKKLTPNDNLLIFYAGHGYYDKDMEEGYWVPSKARKNKPSDYISNSEIINFIKAIKTKHTLLICDACFAGSLFQSPFRGEANINYMNYEKRKSRWAITSGGVEKVEDQSVFCQSLIDYLEDNEKQNVLFSEIADYVVETVSSNSNQMPKAGAIKYVGHEGGQFVFRKTVE